MSQQNKIFTTLNQPLQVQMYNLNTPLGVPQLFSTIEGVPLGTSNNGEDGEVAVKVLMIGSRGDNPNSSASGVVTVTPSDTIAIDAGGGSVRGLYVGGGGNISVVMADGSTAVLVAVPTGMILPMKVVQVNASGTTATDIVALL